MGIEGLKERLSFIAAVGVRRWLLAWDRQWRLRRSELRPHLFPRFREPGRVWSGKGRRVDMTSYWVVGASWDGVEHQDKLFVEQGIWMLGYEDGYQRERASQIKSRDRIAPSLLVS